MQDGLLKQLARNNKHQIGLNILLTRVEESINSVIIQLRSKTTCYFFKRTACTKNTGLIYAYGESDVVLFHIYAS